MSTFILIAYAVAALGCYWNSWFCEQQVEKCRGRAERNERDGYHEDALYWVGRADWWLRSSYYNLAGAVLMVVFCAVFAVRSF